MFKGWDSHVGIEASEAATPKHGRRFVAVLIWKLLFPFNVSEKEKKKKKRGGSPD